MWPLVVLAAVALTIDLTVSHGSWDAFWLGSALLLLIASYVVRAKARRASVYSKQK